jgi:FkbM family methyltransferase
LAKLPIFIGRSSPLLRAGRALRPPARRLTNEVLRVAGVDLRWKPDALIRSSYEIPLTFEYVASHFACRHANHNVTLMQIGACDGVANDPVAEALELHGWRAVLIEPQREPFKALERLYAGKSNVLLFNVAIADEQGFRDLYSVGSSQTASFDRSHVAKHIEHRDVARIVAEPVECWTFDILFERAGVERVDVLQVDAEGYDFQLLRLFDIPSRLPSIVNYEHRHLSRSDRNEAVELLISHGYRLAMSRCDTVAYRHS